MLLSAFSVRYILQENFPNYPKGKYVHDILEDLLGDGIFNTDGALWEKQRKIASHLFKQNSLRYMTTVFAEHGKKV